MRVIAEKNLQMSDRDEKGMHRVKDKTCKDPGPCFCFNCNGRAEPICDRFRKLSTGVKICART